MVSELSEQLDECLLVAVLCLRYLRCFFTEGRKARWPAARRGLDLERRPAHGSSCSSQLLQATVWPDLCDFSSHTQLGAAEHLLCRMVLPEADVNTQPGLCLEDKDHSTSREHMWKLPRGSFPLSDHLAACGHFRIAPLRLAASSRAQKDNEAG